MHETDFAVRTWEVERDDVLNYLYLEAEGLRQEGKDVLAVNVLAIAQEIENGKHVNLYK